MVEARRDLTGVSADTAAEVDGSDRPVLIRHFINGIDQPMDPVREGLRTRFVTRVGEHEGLSIQWDPTMLMVDKAIIFSSVEEKQLNTDRLEGAGWQILEVEFNGMKYVIPFISATKYSKILGECID